MLRALIVDDEKPARDELAYLLCAHPDVEAAQASTAAQALAAMASGHPDLVLCDIHMPGADGFDILRQAQTLPHVPLFVFVTAYDQHAIEAFEQNAVDYLLKPVAPERLSRTLARVRQRLDAARALPEAGPEGPEAGPGRVRPLDRLAVEQHGRIRLMPVGEVVCIEAEDKGVMAVTDQGRLPCHGVPTLTRAEERLAGQCFFRANRAVLVNLERIAELSPWVGGKYLLVMNDPERTEVTVSRNRVAGFKERLGL
jgi:two-component system LytT family response regulator